MKPNQEYVDTKYEKIPTLSDTDSEEKAFSEKIPDIHCHQSASGIFVLRIIFGSSYNFTENFWRAFKKEIRIWDKVLSTQLANSSFPETPLEIRKLTSWLSQATERSGEIILFFNGIQHLKDGPIKSFVNGLYNIICGGVAVIVASDELVDVGLPGRSRTVRTIDGNKQYTREEIRIYYTALGIILNDKILDKIQEITLGWSEAVLLLGKHLKYDEAITPYTIDIAVTYMFGTIQREFYSHSEKFQQGMIRLSLLEGFTIELAVDLTVLTADDLRDFFKFNCFVLVKSNAKTHYFHPIYHQFLKNHQMFLTEKEKHDFFLQAAQWYDRKKALKEALVYYSACGEYDQILLLLQKNLMLPLNPELIYLLVNILEKMPEEYTQSHPQHRFCLFLVLYHHSDRRIEGYQILNELHKELAGKKRNPQENWILGEVYLAKAFLCWLVDSEPFLTCIKRANKLLPNGSKFLDDDKVYSPGGSALRFQAMKPGELLQRKKDFLAAIPYSKNLLPNTGISKNYLAAAEAHLYRSEMDEARKYISLTLKEAGKQRHWGVICEAEIILLRIAMAEGTLDELLYYNDQIRVHSKKLTPSKFHYVYDIFQLQIYAYLGLYHLAENSLDLNSLQDPYSKPGHGTGRELYGYARYLISVKKQYRPALTYMDNAMTICYENGMWFSYLKLVILTAIVYSKLSMKDLAAEHLIRAYEMSSGNGITFSFIELGKDVAELIGKVKNRIPGETIPQIWLEEISAGARRFEKHKKLLSQEFLQQNPHLSMHRLESLTDQEYLALQHICEGLSTEEAAEKMGVQVSTIYIYLHRSYKKLGADSREEAIQIAVKEGILGKII